MEELEKQEVEQKPEKKKKKSVLGIFFSRNKIGFFLLVFFTLVANAFAWFIYSQIVSTEVTANVKAWNITMNGEHDGVLEFTLDDLYPGMTDHTETVMIANTGDLDARVTFSIHSITVMGQTYTIESASSINLYTLFISLVLNTLVLTGSLPLGISFIIDISISP